MTISPVYSGRPDTLREPVEQRVYELLDALHIPYQRVDHEPAYDMDACAGISEALGITICKNLLLTPRNRSAFYLLAMPARLSFASPEDLQALLGVQPGSASVLGLMNDIEHRVTLALERRVAEAEWFGCHPCRNTSSLRLKTADLLHVFLPHIGVEPIIVDL